MVNLFRRLFIKDYQNITDEKVRAKHAFLAAGIGCVTNLLLIVIKLGVALYAASLSGWIIFPLAIVSDAINNLSDLLSCFLVLIGFREASKPADAKHPFGHQRAEYITGLLVACAIIVIGVEMGRESISDIIEQTHVDYGITTMIVYSIAILIKAFQGYCYVGLGKAIGSAALKNNALDSLGDILASIAILVSALLGLTLGWNFLDPYLSLAVSLLILIGAIKLLKDSIDPLLGSPQDAKTVELVINEAKSHEHVLAVHDVIIHSYGPTERYITLHIEVPSSLELIEAHKTADEIEKIVGLKAKANVLVHIDPVREDKKREGALKICQDLMLSLEPEAKIHDFQITDNNGVWEFSFDVLLPFAKMECKDKISKMLRKSLMDTYKGCLVNINFDHPF